MRARAIFQLSIPIIFVVLFLHSQPVAAATTTLRPGQSIQAAVDAAAAGDTILLESGTWQEQVVIRREGVTLAAAPGATPILDGGYRLPGGNAARCDPRTGNCFVYSPLLSIQANDVVVDGLTIQQSRGRGIGVSNGATNVTVSNCRIENVRNAGLHVTQASFVTLERCVVTGAANYAPYSRSASQLNWPVIVNVVSASDVIIKNNTIHENWGEGVAAGRNSQRVQIIGNQIYNNYALQVYAHRTRNTIIYGNLIYFTTDPTFYRGNRPSDCIVVNAEEEFETALTTANVQIVNNIVAGCGYNMSFWGNEGGGVPTTNVLVAHNTFSEATEAALKIVNGGVLQGVQVRNNIFAQAGRGSLLQAPNILGNGITFESNQWDAAPPERVQSGRDSIAPVPFTPLLQRDIIPELFFPNAGAINRAGDVGVACDYFGHGRVGLPDIGAVEIDGVPLVNCSVPEFPAGSVGPPQVSEFIRLDAKPPAESGSSLTILLIGLMLLWAILTGASSL